MHIHDFVPQNLVFHEILIAIREAGGSPFIVGGSVRDAVIENVHGNVFASKDMDVEVFGLNRQDLKSVLRHFGSVNDVGESFAVIKVRVGSEEFDFSLPRRDNKVSAGTRGFDIIVDHTMTVAEAAQRRDFTFNALSLDPFTGEVFDPFGGIDDIRNRILRPTSHHFAEDPLRILRGFQFVSRFDFEWSDDMVAFGKSLAFEFHAIPQERIAAEWMKWASRSVKPSRGLRFLQDVGWLKFFPEIAAMVGVPQDAEWHPEGDVFDHTCHVVDTAAWQCERDGIIGERRTRIMFAALLHDTGKPSHTWKMEPNASHDDRVHWSDFSSTGANGRWRSPGHETAGSEPSQDFMNRLFKSSGQTSSPSITDAVVSLVITHMRHVPLDDPTPRAVRRLARDVVIADMEQVVNADHNGRPFDPDDWCASSQMTAILLVANELAIADSGPEPILMGRHLIEMGMSPGKNFGIILAAAFEAQLDGMFDDVATAKVWVSEYC